MLSLNVSSVLHDLSYSDFSLAYLFHQIAKRDSNLHTIVLDASYLKDLIALDKSWSDIKMNTTNNDGGWNSIHDETKRRLFVSIKTMELKRMSLDQQRIVDDVKALDAKLVKWVNENILIGANAQTHTMNVSQKISSSTRKPIIDIQSSFDCIYTSSKSKSSQLFHYDAMRCCMAGCDTLGISLIINVSDVTRYVRHY